MVEGMTTLGTRRKFLKGAALAAGAASISALGWPSIANAVQDAELSGYLPAQGGRLWFRVNGAKFLEGPKAPLLCLHGGPGGNSRSMISMLALADERAVVFYDQLDGGNSDRPGDPINWKVERFVSEIDSVRDALKLSQVVLVGHSMGTGWIVDYLGGGNPQGVKAAVLGSPFVRTKSWEADAVRLRLELPASIQADLSKYEKLKDYSAADYQAATKAYVDMHYCLAPCDVGDAEVDAPSYGDAVFNHMWGPSDADVQGTLKSYDVSAKLSSIKVPTLVLCGDKDAATPETSRQIADAIPDSDFWIIANSAHSIYLEQPESVTANVRRFLMDRNI